MLRNCSRLPAAIRTERKRQPIFNVIEKGYSLNGCSNEFLGPWGM